MKNSDFGVVELGSLQRSRSSQAAKKSLTGTIITLYLILCILGFGAAAHSSNLVFSKPELAPAEHALSHVSHELLRRQDCNETSVTSTQTADAATAISSSSTLLVSSLGDTSFTAAEVTKTSNDNASVPISPITETATTTIHSIRRTPDCTALTSTTTAPETCSGLSVTKTVYVTIHTISNGDATVIGSSSTVTNVKTDHSYTTGPPDATVSGNPSTITDVHTDISMTSGLPDATVPGNPSTLTNTETSYSAIQAPPDATVSGNPSTVTKVYSSWSLSSISANTVVTTVVISDLLSSKSKTTQPTVSAQEVLTTVTTTNSVLVTVTVTKQSQPPAYGTDQRISLASSKVDGEAFSTTTPLRTLTSYVTKTSGTAAVSFTTVHVPYPGTNTTEYTVPTGGVTSAMTVTATAVTGSGSKVSSPGIWNTRSGVGSVASAFLLVAVVMFMI